MLTGIVGDLMNQVDDSFSGNKNKLAAEIKMRIWDSALALAKDRNVFLNYEIIHEVVDNIDSINVFLNEYKESNSLAWELNKIVDEELCAKCGTCTIVCPNNLLEFGSNPQLKKACLRSGHGMCYEICPRISSDKYQIKLRSKLNEKFYSGKRSLNSNTNEIVTSFLKYLLKKGKIDGAIVIGDDHWKPISLLVKTPESLDKSIKSLYSISTLDALRQAGEIGLEKVAVVALPCQIAGLRKIQYFPYLTNQDSEIGLSGNPVKIPKIEYLISMFCTEKFDFNNLEKILNENEINIEDVTKFEIKGYELEVTTVDDFKKIFIKNTAISSGCKFCKDFDGELADLSIGSAGSPKGFSTIVVRSEKGREIANVVDLKENVDLDEINRFKELKLNRFNTNIQKRKDEGKFIPYYWNSDYAGVSKDVNNDYFIRIRANPSGLYTSEEIRKIQEIATDFEAMVKLTSRGAFELHNLAESDVETVAIRLNDVGFVAGSNGPNVFTVLSCPGNSNCKSGLINSVDLCEKIEDKFKERPTPYKFKVSISGCPNKCSRSQIHDFGIVGSKIPKTNPDKCNSCGRCYDVCSVGAIEITEDSAITDYSACIGCGKCLKNCPNGAILVKDENYILYIGGKAGRDLIEGFSLKVDSEEDIMNYLDAVLLTYDKLAIELERLASTIKRVGKSVFIEELNNCMKN